MEKSLKIKLTPVLVKFNVFVWEIVSPTMDSSKANSAVFSFRIWLIRSTPRRMEPP